MEAAWPGGRMHRNWCIRPDRVHTWEISAFSRPPDPVSAQEKSERDGKHRRMQNYVGEVLPAGYGGIRLAGEASNRLNDAAAWAIIS